ncbi:DEAD/DEAH box helicase [Niallia sp. Krafla_26]|uniref:DEAD/DEAH box helicase n=1 Tax=Niallia sp. Krafla_26 TaxID=3064703 RepID=UPI003D16B23B
MAFFKRKSEFTLEINRTLQSDGILLSIFLNKELVSLPVRLTISELKKINNIDLLQLVEDLFLDNKIIQVEVGKYLLSYEEVYKITPEERELLNLPPNITYTNVELDNDSFVGSRTFKFIPKIHSDKYVNLHRIGQRKGPFIELPSKEIIMLDESHYQFLKDVENEPINDNDLFLYIARVKKHAKSLGIPVSQHIERENYEFIDEVDIAVKKTDQGIELSPTFQHEYLEEDELNIFNETNNWYAKKDSKRIFVDKKARENGDKIKKLKTIEGKDIPKFVQNPIGFIPEEIEISLDDFSDRVKSLGIRVYKAQPFVNANRSENGWFEYETGFVLKDNEGNSISKETESYFQDEELDFKQVDENTYIEVPDNVAEFKKLSKDLKVEAVRNRSNKLDLSNYILEIFENISNVEYNQPLLDLREELKNQQVFEITPPSTFKAILKPFQEDGFIWMKTLRYKGVGGLLADDMGLGKTIQVIAFLTYLKEMNRLGPSLLVLPKSLIQNWVNEMEKFAPVLTKNHYVHTGPERSKKSEEISKYDIVLTTYQTLVRDQLFLGRIDWQFVICDEAQAIKNPTTSSSVVVKALKNKGRLALTGTPVENNLSELWSIVDFVQPGILGSLKDFKKQYETTNSDQNSYDTIRNSIEEKLKFIYKRRTKSGELKDQLPVKYEHKVPVAMGKEQEKIYLDIIRKTKSKEVQALQGIMNLKMLCSHPGLIQPPLSNLNYKKVPKLDKTMQILNEVKEKKEKVLIFSEYRKMQAILKKNIINIFETNPMIINGETNSRQEIVDEFNNSDGFGVLILSPKAAGTGLTITGANHVIHYTRWWNPAVENQATDRVYRIGQEKEVHVYYPIIQGNKGGQTVEEVVDALLSRKNELAENVIVPSRNIDIENELLKQLQLH